MVGSMPPLLPANCQEEWARIIMPLFLQKLKRCPQGVSNYSQRMALSGIHTIGGATDRDRLLAHF